ncbi:FAD-binding oxidoreductase [Gilvimarinus sp. SDUM040013]|uniref:FAD-binding oxidoreductase n=1 Tax=Gilvimarinus gilvus TaxID=3058038 RepID=A0ABU4RZC9_9GAMM|nr:FAD-binding oxidoreductase [Gilvimarinus sp. SDUM040013]MDO3384669.1 FAD-binding oxidoreductase [Gilvimarinus sp. SDUM040013]MDX6850255.1 FAD-binding oxidoreductase [Gilvimarinus sp. SDUM040013]
MSDNCTIKTLAFIGLLLCMRCAHSEEPSEASTGGIALFTTDGCSRFPDGTWADQQLWQNCCVQHDFAYWKGGSYSERAAADRELEACVAQLGESEIGLLMFLGVRIGGTPFVPTDFRWGYGWQQWRGYQALSEEEHSEINKALQQMDPLLKAKLPKGLTQPEHAKLASPEQPITQ